MSGGRIHWVWVALALCWLPGFSPAQDGPDPAPLIAAIKAAAPDALARHGTPGVAVAMVLGGAPVWSGGFGVADVETGRPITADTVFEIASLTKPVTAWAMLKLAEEGLIDLDAPIEAYLTNWQLTRSDYDHSGVTARSILAHAAGLSNGRSRCGSIRKPYSQSGS